MNREKVKVTKRDGSHISLAQWQYEYGLPKDSDKIGRHFYLTEIRFLEDLHLFGELVVNAPLMMVMDGLREAAGKPVKVNSYNRSQAKQDQLKTEGFRTATYSPHVVKMAADIDTNDDDQTRDYVLYLRQVSQILGIKIRIGHKQYMQAGQTFVHVDVCPEYYAPSKPFHHHQHPIQWESAIEW